MKASIWKHIPFLTAFCFTVCLMLAFGAVTASAADNANSAGSAPVALDETNFPDGILEAMFPNSLIRMEMAHSALMK